jgi:hypothetical protein
VAKSLFGTKVVKNCSSQDLMICIGVMRWSTSNLMTCIPLLGSSVMGDVISNIPIHNQIVNFDTLNDHDPNSNDRHLTPDLNFAMHKGPIGENSNHQSHLPLKKIK